MKSLFGQKSLKRYCQLIIQDKDNIDQIITLKKGEKTAVCQAITSIYGGKDLWNSEDTRSMEDGLFEIIILGGSFSLGVNQIGIHTGRCVIQGKLLTLTTNNPCFIQVDGEGMFLENPTIVKVEKDGFYPILKR